MLSSLLVLNLFLRPQTTIPILKSGDKISWTQSNLTIKDLKYTKFKYYISYDGAYLKGVSCVQKVLLTCTAPIPELVNNQYTLRITTINTKNEIESDKSVSITFIIYNNPETPSDVKVVK